MQALKGVDFSLEAGEVHALVGENGAGKSTLVKILTGAVTADAGTITVGGQQYPALTPSLAKELGIGIVYQQPSVFGELTITENIALGVEGASVKGKIDWDSRKQRAEELLQSVGASIDCNRLASSLSLPEQQLVEIAKALGTDAKVLILDEPTASLSEVDAQHLFTLVRRLRAEGRSIIYISHRLEELFEIADRVTVLRDGQTITTQPICDLSRQELVRLMAGRELSQVFPKRGVPIGEKRITIAGIDLHAGEIVGMAGLVGAGRTELAQDVFFESSSEVAYLPEDRRKHGVIPEMSVSANITLASLQRFFLDFDAERQIAEAFREKLLLKTHSVESPVSTLSGGNQQKVAIARWLATGPGVLILDEPTQGVDVGAKSEIHRLMCDLAEQGMAILMISSELPEILGMSDRIAVMRQNRIVGIVDRADATQDKILSLMLGESE